MVRIIKDKSGHSSAISLEAHDLLRFMPHGYPFNLIDRVKYCNFLTGVNLSIKNITLTDPVLIGHFKDYPIYPGVLIIEALAQNAGFFMLSDQLYKTSQSYEELVTTLGDNNRELDVDNYQAVLADSRIKHIKPVYPGDSLLLESNFIMKRDNLSSFKVSATVEGELVAKGQVVMAATHGNPEYLHG